MPWIEQPTRGFITGLAVDGEGKALDGATVRVKRSGWFQKTERLKTDGNGWFGLTERKRGRYTARLEYVDGSVGDPVTIEVRPGGVTRLKAPLVSRSR